MIPVHPFLCGLLEKSEWEHLANTSQASAMLKMTATLLRASAFCWLTDGKQIETHGLFNDSWQFFYIDLLHAALWLRSTSSTQIVFMTNWEIQQLSHWHVCGQHPPLANEKNPSAFILSPLHSSSAARQEFSVSEEENRLNCLFSYPFWFIHFHTRIKSLDHFFVQQASHFILSLILSFYFIRPASLTLSK